MPESMDSMRFVFLPLCASVPLREIILPSNETRERQTRTG